MNIKGIVFIVVIILFFTTPVFAGSISNRIEPIGNMKFAAAIEDNLIFDRDIKGSGTVLTGELDITNQVYGKLIMGITDYVNLYTKLGASECSFDYRMTNDERIEIECKYGFLGGIGGIVSYEFMPNWNIGLDTQFNWWQCDADEVKLNGGKATSVSGEIESWEFQTALFLNAKCKIEDVTIRPYVGGVFSYFETESEKDVQYTVSSNNRSLSWDLENDDYFGVVAGADISLIENLNATVEVRFICETALTAGLAYSF